MLLNTSATCIVIFNWGMTRWLALFTSWKAFNPLVTSIIGITMQEKSRSNKRSSLKKQRTRAFYSQGGVCYYCNQPMWNKKPQELTSQYPISSGQAQFLRCTGEHLESHSEGGSSGSINIVAACWYCNQNRHRRKNKLSPENFGKHARRRLSKGAWHGLNLAG